MRFLIRALLLPFVAGFLPLRQQHSSSTARAMFTGIVEEMGTVVSLEERDDMILWDGTKGKGTEFAVKGKIVLEGAYLG